MNGEFFITAADPVVSGVYVSPSAQHEARSERSGEAEARREIRIVSIHSSSIGDTVLSGDHQLPGLRVEFDKRFPTSV
jgi:hypothetical protein